MSGPPVVGSCSPSLDCARTQRQQFSAALETGPASHGLVDEGEDRLPQLQLDERSSIPGVMCRISTIPGVMCRISTIPGVMCRISTIQRVMSPKSTEKAEIRRMTPPKRGNQEDDPGEGIRKTNSP